ncbi:MAG: HAD-IC family P-type ATPase [Actinomycetia bacterium]|nr:HAD-IC family P-type ATPase [Actinomycetes bacterium]
METFEADPGRGVRARVEGHIVQIVSARALAEAALSVPRSEPTGGSQAETSVGVAADGTLVGVVVLTDPVKDTAPEAVAALCRDGITVYLLTGDARPVAEAVARTVGIGPANVIADVLPGDQAGVIRSLQAAGHRVAMVGHGINDAPALATAGVGIALGTGTDGAVATAGITLMNGDPRGVAAVPSA